jgi:hypothetical protein
MKDLIVKAHMHTKYILFLLEDMYYKGKILYFIMLIPATNGMLGGLYLPSKYGTDYGMGTVL